MHIEIKDLQTGQSHRIEDAGAKLGRDKNRADVVISDPGVSGAHARIHFKDEKWWLEDLKSSNGTFIDNDRVLAPAVMQKGMTFRFHTHRFEVIDMEPDADAGRTSVFSASTAVAKEPAKDASKESFRDSVTHSGVSKAEVKEHRDDAPPVTETARVQEKAAEKSSEKHSKPPPDETEENDTIEPPQESTRAPEPRVEKKAPKKDAEPREKKQAADTGKKKPAPAASNGGFGKQLPIAIAYYLAAIPKLPFAFKNMVAESIATQRFTAMVPMELAAWALPPQLLSAIVSAIVGLGVMLIVGQLAIVSWVISLAIALAIGVAVAIVSGFIFHPVMGWLIRILKGKSDETTRTNYFVMLMAAVGLTTIISGLAALFAILPVPFIGVAPVLLMLVGTLISLYTFYKWFEYFAVAKWFLTLLLVLGGLSILNTLYNSYRVVDAGIASFRNSASSPHVVQLKLGDGKDEAKGDDSRAKADDGKGKADDGKGDGRNETKGSDSKGDSKLPEPKAEPRGKADGKASARGSTTSDDYEAYVKKREAVEQAIEKNPTLLTRIEGVLPLYKQMHFQISKVQEKYKKSKGDVVADRLRDAEVYEKTVDAVNELHRKLVEGAR